MLNTYGIRSVNRETFNTQYHETLYFPRYLRNIIITALRIHNGALNVLGYIPGISTISGSIRMVTGLGIVGITMTIGDPDASEGAIIGRWYNEAVDTGIAQIARGVLEVFAPFGNTANAALDIVTTPINLAKEMVGSSICEGCMAGSHVTPHNDVEYPLLLQFLHLA